MTINARFEGKEISMNTLHTRREELAAEVGPPPLGQPAGPAFGRG